MHEQPTEYVPLSERPSAELIGDMHEMSVHLWNAFWREAGENFDFAQRERIETVQKILGQFWEEASRA